VISYDSQRGGVSVITEKGDITTSYLLIQNADLADSGRYSCSPSNADVASVRVHVLNGNLDFSFSFLLKNGKIFQDYVGLRARSMFMSLLMNFVAINAKEICSYVFHYLCFP
jgi:hypothetical protein